MYRLLPHSVIAGCKAILFIRAVPTSYRMTSDVQLTRS